MRNVGVSKGNGLQCTGDEHRVIQKFGELEARDNDMGRSTSESGKQP